MRWHWPHLMTTSGAQHCVLRDMMLAHTCMHGVYPAQALADFTQVAYMMMIGTGLVMNRSCLTQGQLYYGLDSLFWSYLLGGHVKVANL